VTLTFQRGVTLTSVPAAGWSSSAAALAPRANNSYQVRSPSRVRHPELPGANDVSPVGTSKVPSVTVASTLRSPMWTRTRVPDDAGGCDQVVFRLP
jgi:hypothetical protein